LPGGASQLTKPKDRAATRENSTGRRLRALNRRDPVANPIGFLYLGLVHVGAGLGQIILALVPLLTLLLAVAQGLERFRWQGLLGASVAVAGIAVIFGDQLGAHIPVASLIAVLLGAASMAESNVIIKFFPRVHPLATNAVAMGVGCLLLLVATLITAEPLRLPSDSRPSSPSDTCHWWDQSPSSRCSCMSSRPLVGVGIELRHAHHPAHCGPAGSRAGSRTSHPRLPARRTARPSWRLHRRLCPFSALAKAIHSPDRRGPFGSSTAMARHAPSWRRRSRSRWLARQPSCGAHPREPGLCLAMVHPADQDLKIETVRDMWRIRR